MLAVVEDQQRRPVAQRVREARGRGQWRARGAGRVVPDPDHRADRLPHLGPSVGRGPDGGRRRVERRELHQVDTAGELRAESGRGRQRELRLADAAGPGEGHQPVGAQQLAYVIDGFSTADQLGERRRYVARRAGRRCGGRGRGGERRVLGEDRAVQGRQRGTRIHPQLLGQPGAQLRVAAQCRVLAAGEIQGPQMRGAQPLP